MSPSPRTVLLPISLATALSLLGDTTLYTVLPTHYQAAGVALASVGLLLSANRWIRLPLNGPAGYLLERLPRKPVFTLAMLLGTLSTLLYAVDNGFALLLAARLLWGVSWVGIWVGGNMMVLDVTDENNRGKWLGVYQIAFFTGAGGSAALGGLLTDFLGYHPAMAINAALTFAGVLIAWAGLRETRPEPALRPMETPDRTPELPAPRRTGRGQTWSAVALLASGRLVQEGFLLATLALFIKERMGSQVFLAGQPIGTTTLTGLGLGLTTLVAAAAAPLAGTLSDRAGSRWRTAALFLIPGIAGFAVLQSGTPGGILAGLVGVSFTSGSCANLSTALIGDLGMRGRHGRRLGGLFTAGDLASAAGPLLAFWAAPRIGLNGVYWTACGVFGLLALVAAFWSLQGRRERLSGQT